jgi:hypothetical protein
MAAVSLIGSYNYALVALSVFIGIFASYAALDLAGRITAAGGWTEARDIYNPIQDRRVPEVEGCSPILDK